jgi:hypothetical protein
MIPMPTQEAGLAQDQPAKIARCRPQRETDSNSRVR